MNWLFRRHFWVVHLVFLGIAAIILAKASSAVFGYWLTKKVGDKLIIKPVSRKIEPKEEKIFAIANERNLFQAKREHVSLEDDLDEDEGPGRWQDAGPSSLSLKLISTLVFSDPFSSRAVILNTSTNKSSVYSINECDRYKKQNSLDIETILPKDKWEPNRPCNNVDGMATIRRIEEFKVYIFNSRDRKWEYLSLMGEERRPKIPLIFGKEEEEGGIRKVGAHSYEIDQSALDKALGNVAKLMTEAKALPKTDASGNIIGFEMVYIKDKSLFEKIGIEKMDVLTRINGYDLSSLEKALELFSKLRYSDKFTIDFLRGGRPVTSDFAVIQNSSYVYGNDQFTLLAFPFRPRISHSPYCRRVFSKHRPSYPCCCHHSNAGVIRGYFSGPLATGLIRWIPRFRICNISVFASSLFCYLW